MSSPERLWDDYRHLEHIENIRSNVMASLDLNGRQPRLGDFEKASPETLERFKWLLGGAKAAWSERHGIDPYESFSVLEELTKIRNRDAARRIFDAEQGGESNFDSLYLPRSVLDEMKRGDPLIRDVLDRHTLVNLAGRDQSYKSFVALDWLCCLSTGIPWLGHSVERTRCLYVIGEGAWSLDPRIAAWEGHHGVRVFDEWFQVRTAPVNLFRGGRPFDDLLGRIDGEGVGLVIFDTLRRCSAGANLNLEADAGVVISNLDRVRDATDDGSVGFVAHTDKADNDTRGSGALEDDIDIVWRATKLDGGVKLTLDKHKDGPEGLTHSLAPKLAEGSLLLTESYAHGIEGRAEIGHARAAVVAMQKLTELDDMAEATMNSLVAAWPPSVKASRVNKLAGIDMALHKGWLTERRGANRARFIRLGNDVSPYGLSGSEPLRTTSGSEV